MNETIIVAILSDWKNNMPHGQIREKYLIPKEQEFAITCCSAGLATSEIMQKIINVEPGMKALQIRKCMKKL